MSNDIKHLKGVQREMALQHLATHGPGHGKAGTIRSKRDKANCPKRQRKQRDWLRD